MPGASDVAFPRLSPRAADSHKGDFGRALVVAGSRGMSGAAALVGMAALRSGAGLVTVATADPCLETVASFEPCFMTIPLPADDAGRLSIRSQGEIESRAEPMTCLACGPGWGRSDELCELIDWMYGGLSQPMVIDADGLNNLSQRKSGLANPAGPRILTPHPGEFSRLCPGERLSREDAEERAAKMAADNGIVVLLKGHRTFITDGVRHVHNTTGNPGMSSGGTGDVLTGVICALVCQGLAPFEAAWLGAHVHGLAGDVAAEQKGQVGLIARDVIDSLPEAFLRLEEETTS